MEIQTRFTKSHSQSTRLAKRSDGMSEICGYGAVFYDGTPDTEYPMWPGAVERIMPGAFDRALREDDVRGLFNHDPNLLLGRTASGTMRLRVDDVGLWYSIDSSDTSVSQDVREHLRRGDVSGSSFSFWIGAEEVTKETRGGEDLIVSSIYSLDKLFDVGPVAFPAYVGTTAGTRGISPEEVARRVMAKIDAEEFHGVRKHGPNARRFQLPDVVRTRLRVLELEDRDDREKQVIAKHKAAEAERANRWSYETADHALAGAEVRRARGIVAQYQGR